MRARPKLVGDPDHLAPSWARETTEAAPAGTMADCDVCKAVEAGCFGFGSFIGQRGIWSCQDQDCRAEAKARASGQRNLIAAE